MRSNAQKANQRRRESFFRDNLSEGAQRTTEGRPKVIYLGKIEPTLRRAIESDLRGMD